MATAHSNYVSVPFLIGKKKSGGSNRPLTPILLKSIAIHLPFLSRYFCKSMPSSWQKVVYTPPICITIRLPFVSRYFCRSIRVTGRWGTPKKSIHHHRGDPPFFIFSFSGSEALSCIPFFPDLWCIPFFPCFPRKMVYTIAFCCSVTSGSGHRLRKEGSRGGGVYSFFPLLKTIPQGKRRLHKASHSRQHRVLQNTILRCRV